MGRIVFLEEMKKFSFGEIKEKTLKAKLILEKIEGIMYNSMSLRGGRVMAKYCNIVNIRKDYSIRYAKSQ